MPDFASSLGKTCAVIGAQWGDEGKGKAIDLLSGSFDVIARACGGANAGHTIVVGGKKHVFRLLPSGCLHAHAQVFLGSGMVIHLPTLLEEVRLLKDAGVSILDRMWISPSAHVVFEYHKEIDAAIEDRKAKTKGGSIGTTRRGIGPAYADKAARTGLRMEILHWTDDAVRSAIEDRAPEIKRVHGVAVDVDAECRAVKEAAGILRHCVVRHGPWQLHRWLEAGKRVLVEGAQATLLDIDHGTYPHVTSSQTTAAGALQGLGLPPKALASCIGVAKAYCTRVGGGPFPTEADETAQTRLRERGGEYGSVTKRPRRCGWLFIPDLKHSAMINGFDCWNLTKLDVLDEEDEIPVGIGMDDAGNVLWEKLPGWKTSTVGVTEYGKLPTNARAYIEFVESATGLPARLIGTGQGREQMIVR